MRNWHMTTIPVKQTGNWAPQRRVRQRRDFAAMQERGMRAADLSGTAQIPMNVRDKSLAHAHRNRGDLLMRVLHRIEPTLLNAVLTCTLGSYWMTCWRLAAAVV
jgi:hypothetical protein